MTDSEEDLKPAQYRGNAIQAASFSDSSFRDKIRKQLEAAGIEVEEREDEATGEVQEWAGLNLHLYVWEIDVQRAREILNTTSWKDNESFYHLPHAFVRPAEEIQNSGKFSAVLEKKVFMTVCLLAGAVAVSYFILNM